MAFRLSALACHLQRTAGHDLRWRCTAAADIALPTPRELVERELPLPPAAIATVVEARHAIARIIGGEDRRLLVVVGPCSIHDLEAAAEYAERLAVVRARHAGELEVVMRVYFEKPRTTVGWKGLVNDPSLLGTHDVAAGLRAGRGLLQRLGAGGALFPISVRDL